MAERDPERILPFINALSDVWHEHPEWRFGQLVMNLSRTPGGFADIWEWDVNEFYVAMSSLWEPA